MAKAKVKSEKPATVKTSVLDRRWGKAAIKYGYTVVPSILLDKQAALGLDALDLAILIHIVKFWWDPEKAPYPRKATLAAALRVAPRTIQRRIAALEKVGLISRKTRRGEHGGNSSNEYHLDGVVAALKPHAEEGLKEREKQRAEREATRRRRRTLKLRSKEGDE
jgi:DNA-binding transcriptional regulator YhcF (GntR family)